MSVHRAQNLEFPVVYVAGMTNSKMPGSFRQAPLRLGGFDQSREDFNAESRRLAYVALTRATERVVFTSALRYTAGGRAQVPSRYVSEAMHEWDKTAAARAKRFELSRPPLSEEEEVLASDLLARGRLGPNFAAVLPPMAPDAPIDLSYTRIGMYLKCPMQYFFRYGLGLASAPAPALMYGSAMHLVAAKIAEGKTAEGPDGLRADLRAAWTRAGFDSERHEADKFAAGLEGIARFAMREAGNKADLVEHEFRVDAGNGVTVHGFIDRVDRDRATGGPVLRELKSSYSGRTLQTDAQMARNASMSMQLPLYGWSYRKLFGETPQLRLDAIESGATATVPFDETVEAEVADVIDTVAKAVRRGRFRAKPAPFTCRFCDFKDSCPQAAA